LFPLFATGVNDTGDKFTASVIDTEKYQTANKFAAMQSH
jgi:hypothetical protein